MRFVVFVLLLLNLANFEVSVFAFVHTTTTIPTTSIVSRSDPSNIWKDVQYGHLSNGQHHPNLKYKRRLSSSSSSSSSLSVSTASNTRYSIPSDSTTIQQADIVICGGGPAGLLSAIMFGQKYGLSAKNSNTAVPIKIVVIDRLSKPPSSNDASVWNTDIGKYYLIGLGGRGQAALQQYGVWDTVKDKCVPVVGRKDWNPQNPNPKEIIVQKRITTQVLPRDKLVSVLYEYIQEHLQQYVTFYYGYEVNPINFHYNDETQCLIQAVSCTPTSEEQYKTSKKDSTTTNNNNNNKECDVDNAMYMATKLLIGSDGTIRSIANSIEAEDKGHYNKLSVIQKVFNKHKLFYVKRYVDDNQRLYKSIPFRVPKDDDDNNDNDNKSKDWRNDLNYSGRTVSGLTFEALPANDNGDYCGILLIKDTDTVITDQTIHDPTKLRTLFNKDFPQFSSLITDSTIQSVAAKSMSALPSFRYVAPRLHHGNNCVLLGDCIHTVKPYFGLGANSALEDVKILEQSLDAAELTSFRTSYSNNDIINHDDVVIKTNGIISPMKTASPPTSSSSNHINKKIAYALQHYTKKHAKDSKTLVRISRELDRPGTIGFITFILPIILDSIFSSKFPKFFNPNTITMLQNENLKFQQVATIKRRDRLVQASIIFASIALSIKALTVFVNCLSIALRTSPSRVWIGSMITGAIISIASKVRKSTQIKIDASKAITLQTESTENRLSDQKTEITILQST